MSSLKYLLQPMQYLDRQVYRSAEPWVFLAGPIQGAADWQGQAIELIHSIDPNLHIASPRSLPPWHGDYCGQVEWELFHLRLAARKGAILFWLANESTHYCERAYGQTSRFELGLFAGLSLPYIIHLAVGIDTAFPNARYLRHVLSKPVFGLSQVFSTLEETCREAVRLAHDPEDRCEKCAAMGDDPFETRGREWLLGT